ncbi:uncharacterized protein [Penaeus vannamei]|uniref:uncharacterized protein n=1 Tax=Penaeus vannamei TaxID=6689 RepID=UPI000F68C7AF|nr:protein OVEREXPRESSOR OF CATIONIC PEROXIDASE 3-like [Penaeus vannamei]
MGPDRHRRFVVLILVSLFFLVTSWLEEEASESGQGIRATVRIAARRLSRAIGGAEDRKHGRGQRKGDRPLLDDEDEDNDGFINSLYRDDDDDDDKDDDRPSYAKSFRAKSRMYVRTATFHFDLYSCLPRFICEVHAQPPGADLTELEKDIIALFRNYVVMEGPGSPVYSYQLAAHMGQLATGIDPSPCHGLYPSCPLSRPQLLDVLRNVRSSKRMFY